MTTTGQNCYVFQGNTHTMIVVVENDGVPVDLTDYDATWVVYNSTTKETVLTKTTASGGGITIPTPANGEVVISLLPSDTESITPREYNQQLDIELDENTIYTASTGKFIVLYSQI
jgi:hypothetical protein